jgi:hypothetical protein
MARPSLRWAVNTIAYASHVQQVRDGPIRQSRRPSPSAGALHPIDLLVLWPGRRSTLFLYDAAHHLLHKLAVQSPALLYGLTRSSRDILPDGEGVLLILIGDMAKVASAYEHPQSLLWRDAGALLQTLNLTASAYGQAFCAMGVLGNEVLPAIGAPPQSCALGVAMLGITVDL